eukprot:1161551-Pelagomonas_calceolata.AAC.7
MGGVRTGLVDKDGDLRADGQLKIGDEGAVLHVLRPLFKPPHKVDCASFPKLGYKISVLHVLRSMFKLPQKVQGYGGTAQSALKGGFLQCRLSPQLSSCLGPFGSSVKALALNQTPDIEDRHEGERKQRERNNHSSEKSQASGACTASAANVDASSFSLLFASFRLRRAWHESVQCQSVEGAVCKHSN